MHVGVVSFVLSRKIRKEMLLKAFQDVAELTTLLVVLT